MDGASIPAHQYEVDALADAAKGQGETDAPSLSGTRWPHLGAGFGLEHRPLSFVV